MRLSDLQTKDVVNVIDGLNLGKIVDAEVNESGQILYFVIEKKKFFQRVFNSNSDILITIKDIKKIGSDVILVEYTQYQ